MNPTSQSARMLTYLRAHPGATPMQLVSELRIPKYTSRASDLREAGYDIQVTRDVDNVTHYWLNEPLADEVQLALAFAEAS